MNPKISLWYDGGLYKLQQSTARGQDKQTGAAGWEILELR
jgi:hypothetical protein